MTASHGQIHNKILELLEEYYNENPHKYFYGNTEEKLTQVFSNYRITEESPVGIRISNIGKTLLDPVLEKYTYDHEYEVSLGVLLHLDRNMLFPYHIDAQHITFYSKQDAAFFKMGGCDLKGFVKQI